MSPRALAWPCPNVLPGMVPVAAVLARTQETVVAVTGIRAVPAGFEFTLNLRVRNLPRRLGREFWPFRELGPHRGPPWPDEVLRLTVQFADGRLVSSLDAPIGEAPDPDRPMIRSGPGTGGGVDGWSFDMEYRVRPLPPPGPLAFICVWPGRGIRTSRTEVDGGAVRAAADAAVTLWPDDPYCGDDSSGAAMGAPS